MRRLARPWAALWRWYAGRALWVRVLLAGSAVVLTLVAIGALAGPPPQEDTAPVNADQRATESPTATATPTAEPTITPTPTPTVEDILDRVWDYLKLNYNNTSHWWVIDDLVVRVERKGKSVTAILKTEWFPDAEARDLAARLCTALGTAAGDIGLTNIRVTGQHGIELAESTIELRDRETGALRQLACKEP